MGALLAALEECLEYFEDRSDVVDGDYGVLAANKEMQMATMVKEAISNWNARDQLPAVAVAWKIISGLLQFYCKTQPRKLDDALTWIANEERIVNAARAFLAEHKQEGVASVSASAEGGSHSPNSPAVLASKGA